MMPGMKTRLRTLADGSLEWSVAQESFESTRTPRRLALVCSQMAHIDLRDFRVTSKKQSAEPLESETNSEIVLTRDEARWLLALLPAALEQAERVALGLPPVLAFLQPKGVEFET